MKKSEMVLRATEAFPRASRALTAILASKLPPHWLISEIVSRQNLRLIAKAQLSNGMKVSTVIGDGVSETIRRDGCYEPETVKAVLTQLTAGMVFYDVGAHIDQYSLLASEKCSEVHCFEAVPTTFDILQSNIRANALKNVFANNRAVSDCEGTLTIHEGPISNLGSSSLQAPSENSGRNFEVSATTLDAYTQSHAEPDVMKIDVEGAEMSVIAGGRNLLLKKHPALIIEINDCALRRFGHSSETLIRELKSLDYELTPIEGFGFENVLALYRERSRTGI